MRILLTCFAIVLSCQSSVAQPERIFHQRQAGGGPGFGVTGITTLDGNDRLIGLLKHRGLLVMSLRDRGTELIQGSPQLVGSMDKVAYARSMDSGVYMSLRNATSTGILVTPNYWMQIRPTPDQDEPVCTENGPVIASSYVSVDGGITWADVDIVFSDHQLAPVGGAIVEIRGKRGRWYIPREQPIRVRRTGLLGFNVARIRVLSNGDTLVAIGRQSGMGVRFYVCPLDDSSYIRMDSIRLVGGAYRALRPRFIERLESGAILIADSTGDLFIWRGSTAEHIGAIDIGDRLDLDEPIRGVAYWTQQIGDSLIVHQVRCTDPPEIRRLSFHIDFAGFGRGYYWASWSTGIGMTGFMICPLYWRPDVIVDLRTDPPDMLCLESFVRDQEILMRRAMLDAWTDPRGAYMTCTDQGSIVRVDSTGFGHMAHPVAFFDAKYDQGASLASYPLQWWRERGVPAADLRADDMLMPGPFIRRFDRAGRFLDTFSMSPASFVRTQADASVTNGWQGTILRHHSGAVDTLRLPVATPVEHTAFPSDALVLSDGTILASLLGTDTATAGEPMPYRRGGILRSTDGGATFADVDLGLDFNPYVMALHDVGDGSVLAMAYRAIEDQSTILYDPMESTYSIRSGVVLRSADAGRTWTVVHRVTYEGPYRLMTGRFRSHGDPSTIYVPWYRGILASTDGGRSWVDHPDIPLTLEPISIRSSDDGLLIAAADGLHRWNPTTTSVAADHATRQAAPAMRHLDANEAQALLDQGQRPMNILGQIVQTSRVVDLAPGIYLWHDGVRTAVYTAQ